MADDLLDINIPIRVFRGHSNAISLLKVILGEGHTVAMRAGLMRRDFSAKGIALSLADCLIASVCMEYGVILVTENLKDFPAAGLQIRGI